MADSRKRWDTDHRFVGVADASAFAPAVEELAALARRPGWVAEDPEIHLVPHLRGVSVGGMRIVEIAAITCSPPSKRLPLDTQKFLYYRSGVSRLNGNGHAVDQ